jgi:hypothetical protein
MKKHYRTEKDCLNCGAILEGKFCSKCGQENLEIHESFGHMMNHAISDYFHFDHQFFHTLKPLFLRPGYLTNQYMSGKRAQYLHPVKMYIFISIVYFLLLFQSGQSLVNMNENTTPDKKEVANNPMSDKNIDSAKKKIAASPFIPNATKKDLQRDLDKQKKANKKGIVVDTSAERGPNKWFHPLTKDTSYAQYLVTQAKLPESERQNFFENIWNRKVFSYVAKFGPGAKEEFQDDLKHNTPKMMFLLLPLLAVILRVTFWKNKKFYVEHLIYAFHLFCFLFLFMGIAILLKMFIPQSWLVVAGIISFFEAIYIIWYIYRSLRTVYQRGRFRTISKMFGMGIMYFVAFSFCITLLFIATTIF